jgi:hypothetical protein
MSTITETKSAADLLFSHYLRTGERLSGKAAQAFLETKAREDAGAGERKSAESVLFAHYLRTGERFLELKFNQRHYRENGQFARAGEGVSYGGGGTGVRPAARARHSKAPAGISRAAMSNGTPADISEPKRDIVVIGDRDKQFLEDFDATFGVPNSTRRGELRGDVGATAPQSPSRRYRLGSLSKLHESGRSGPETVSSGRNDAGGVSYGLYQFTSRFPVYKHGKIVEYNVGGTVRTFLSSPEGRPWRAEFAALTPGTQNFSEAWQRVAGLRGDQFGDAQHEFIKRTHYEPAVNGVATSTGLNLDSRSDAIRNVAWSVSVQHAKSIEILKQAINVTDRSLDRKNSQYDRALINNIYNS